MAPEQAGPGPSALALEPPQPGGQTEGLPVLYSFRRCPYAIRARLALAAAGLVPERNLVVREVSLACKPPELLEASPKGTVPVLVVPPGADGGPGTAPGCQPDSGPGLHRGSNGGSDCSKQQVIDESLALMTWALARHDPGDWLPLGASPAAQANRAEVAALIAENDGPFKHHLDRFKYPDRFKPPAPRGEPGDNPGGDWPGLQAGDGTSDPEQHRAAALMILARWNDRLQTGGWLLGQRASLADWALLPFVRQFRRADSAGFDAEPDLAALQAWLARFEASAELASVLEPPWGQRQPWKSPGWIYHLALPQEWHQARTAGVYARSTRGLGLEEVGFIHASYAHQLDATYSRFYGDAGPVILLTIDPSRLEQAGVPVRAEPAGQGAQTGAELFPHLYGPLPLAAVVASAPYQP